MTAIPTRNEHSNLVTSFAESVVSGEASAGALFRLACERHLRDLSSQSEWIFDEATASRLFRFFNRLKHYKGEWAGQPIALQPFQAFMIGSLFGWRSR